MPGSREQLPGLTDFPLNLYTSLWLLYLLRRNDPNPRRHDYEYGVAGYLMHPGQGNGFKLA